MTLTAMREVVAPFLKHEPIRPLWAYYPAPALRLGPDWRDEVWAHAGATRPVVIDGVAWGPVPVGVDADDFERCIQYTRDEYERAMGVTPTVIDLPNWARGTILEQIAFNNGFTIADRRPDDDYPR